MKVWWSCGCIIIACSLALAAGGDGGGGKKTKGGFEALFKKLDSNMDGKLTKDEFLKMADRAKEKEQARQKLGQTYDKMDPDNKGISREIFRRFLDSRKTGAGAQDKSK